jgi:uncharacterized protein
MNAPRFRAWQFLHPDLDAPEMESGLRVSPSGGIAMVEENASVRQAILLLISTRLGERVMRPQYGCQIHSLIFAPNDDTTAGLAIHFVRQALDRWEPRIDVLELDAGCNPEHAELLDIFLEYRVKPTQWRERLQFSFHLSGGNA